MKKLFLILSMLAAVHMLSAQNPTIVGIKITRQDNGLPIANRVIKFNSTSGGDYGTLSTDALGYAWMGSMDAGSYTYKVVDCNGDTITTPFTVTTQDTLLLTQAVCVPTGLDCTGEIRMIMTGGNTPSDIYVMLDVYSQSGDYYGNTLIDFGDGSQPEYYVSWHNYTAEGYYPVDIYAHTSTESNIGCSVHIQDTIHAYWLECNGGFTATPDPINPLKYTFTANSPDSVYLEHSWPFLPSPGVASTAGIVNFTFPARGIYYMAHTVDNMLHNCGAVAEDTINVGNVQLNANFTITEDTVVGFPLGTTYKLKSTADMANVQFVWVDGQVGSSINSQDSTYQIYFDSPGTHSVCLRAYRIVEPYGDILDTIENCVTVNIDSSVFSCNGAFTYQIDTATSLISFTANAYFNRWYFVNGTDTTDAYSNNTPTYQAAPGETINVTHIGYLLYGSQVCYDTIVQTIVVPYPEVYQLAGCATINSNPAGDAIIYLLHLDYPNDEIVLVDSAATTAEGCYHFDNIANGDYLVKAVLAPSNTAVTTTLPTYHLSSIDWTDANIFTVSGTGPLPAKDIEMVTGTNPGGPGFIGGSVNWTDTLFRTTVNYSYTTVIVKDSNGQIITYGKASSNGQFSIGNLPVGNFYVSADYAGYITDSVLVTLTEQNPSAVDVGIGIEQAALAVKEEEAIKSITLFPNPAADATVLQLNATHKNVAAVKVINLLGQTVSAKSITLQPGINNYTVDVAHLAKGIYYVSLFTDGKQYTQKLIKY